MKTDRLYAITLYLLNHGKIPVERTVKQEYRTYKRVRTETEKFFIQYK